jgi:hypothetical protein
MIERNVVPSFFSNSSRGDPVSPPKLIEAVLSVPGIESVEVRKFCRHGESQDMGECMGTVHLGVDEVPIPGSYEIEMLQIDRVREI